MAAAESFRQLGQRDPDVLLRRRKAQAFHFKDDGLVPNHPKWPLIVYRIPVRLAGSLDPAAIFEALFARNGWSDSWRDGITTMCTIIPAPTRCWGSRAAALACNSAAARAASST